MVRPVSQCARQPVVAEPDGADISGIGGRAFDHRIFAPCAAAVAARDHAPDQIHARPVGRPRRLHFIVQAPPLTPLLRPRIDVGPLMQINAPRVERANCSPKFEEESSVAWDIITKRPEADRSAPNLGDYEAVRAAFTWEAARAEMTMPVGLNIAYHALDRHVADGRSDKLALRW